MKLCYSWSLHIASSRIPGQTYTAHKVQLWPIYKYYEKGNVMLLLLVLVCDRDINLVYIQFQYLKTFTLPSSSYLTSALWVLRPRLTTLPCSDKEDGRGQSQMNIQNSYIQTKYELHWQFCCLRTMLFSGYELFLGTIKSVMAANFVAIHYNINPDRGRNMIST